jgi:hypothetical protein
VSGSQDGRLAMLTASVKELRCEIRAMREEMTKLEAVRAALDAQSARVLAVQREDETAAARLDALEAVFDADRVASHVREAIARAHDADQPVPHLVIPDLFPRDMYDAICEAIPPRVCFDHRASGDLEVAVPPPMAPLVSVVVWTFVAGVAKRILRPALIRRAGLKAGPSDPTQAIDLERLETSVRSRIIEVGTEATTAEVDPPWAYLTCFLPLGSPHPATAVVFRAPFPPSPLAPFSGTATYLWVLEIGPKKPSRSRSSRR